MFCALLDQSNQVSVYRTIGPLVLRNKFNFWSVHGIMNPSGLLQSKRETLLFMGYKTIGPLVLRNKFSFWSVHGILNPSGLMQSK